MCEYGVVIPNWTTNMCFSFLIITIEWWPFTLTVQVLPQKDIAEVWISFITFIRRHSLNSALWLLWHKTMTFSFKVMWDFNKNSFRNKESLHSHTPYEIWFLCHVFQFFQNQSAYLTFVIVYPYVIWGLKILHTKVCEFAAKLHRCIYKLSVETVLFTFFLGWKNIKFGKIPN